MKTSSILSAVSWLSNFRRTMALFLFLAAASSPAATLVTYPPPAGVTPANDYQVKVEDRELFVYNAPIASIASFDFEGPVTVTITANRDVKWVDVRPKQLGIKPEFKGREIRFTLKKPCNLSVELNGEILRHPLYLFANPLEKRAPNPGDKDVIFFEGGKVHQVKNLELKSGQTVYIAGGAIVQGAIRAQNAENIRILGRGILDGTFNREWKANQFLSFRDCRDVTIEGVTLVNSFTWQIVPVHCENVKIRNVKIASDNGSDDGIDIVRCKKVTIQNCFFHTKDDCIVIKTIWDYPPEAGVENVRVSECVFWNAAWGNALEIGFELRAREVRDVVFENCDVIHVEDGAVFSIHNGDTATVRDIRFENIRVEDARQKLFDLAIFLSQYSADRPSDPAERKRRYLEGAWDGVLSVSPEERPVHAPHRGYIRDVVFKDIAVVDGLFPFSVISGFDEDHRVENVTFKNFTVHGRHIRNPEAAKLYIEHADKIRFK